MSIIQVGLAGLIYAAIIFGWIWGLVSAAKGSRRALKGLLVYELLLAAYAVMDLLVYCPTSCRQIWLYDVANWSNLLFGLLSAAVLAQEL